MPFVSLRYLDVGASKRLTPPVISPHQKRSIDAVFAFKDMMNAGNGAKNEEEKEVEEEEEEVEAEEKEEEEEQDDEEEEEG